jgi:hypothetical protein
VHPAVLSAVNGFINVQADCPAPAPIAIKLLENQLSARAQHLFRGGWNTGEGYLAALTVTVCAPQAVCAELLCVATGTPTNHAQYIA